MEAVRIQRGRRSVHRSVTTQPSSPSANEYSQVLIGTPSVSTSAANRRPASAAVTVTRVIHTASPLRLVPPDFAPPAGPVAPPTHFPPALSAPRHSTRGQW